MADEDMPKKKQLLPPMYFVFAMALMVLLHFSLPIASWLPWPWRAGGVVLTIIGLGFNVVADRQFKRHGTTIKPFQSSSVLVTDGIFGFSRNPMYLGMVLVLVGIGIVLATIGPLALIPVFAWWITTRFVVPEEKDLTRQFGRAFIDYRSRVHRWL